MSNMHDSARFLGFVRSSQQHTPKQIHTHRQLKKDLEGIESSNIVEGGRRRGAAAAAAAAPAKATSPETEEKKKAKPAAGESSSEDEMDL